MSINPTASGLRENDCIFFTRMSLACLVRVADVDGSGPADRTASDNVQRQMTATQTTAAAADADNDAADDRRTPVRSMEALWM